MIYCTENNFDILLTIDKNMLHQQNLEKYPISIVVFDSLTSKLEELLTFIPIFKERLNEFHKHKSFILVKDNY